MGLFDGISKAIFGGGQNFGAAGDLNAGRAGLGEQNSIAGEYGGLGQAALGQYGSDNGAYRSALGNYEGYLSKDPASDNFVAGQEAQATSGTLSAYTRARANLAASAQARGAGGGASSFASGGQAALDSGAAASLSSAGNQAARFNIDQRNQNLGTLTNLTGGVANQDYGRATSDLSQQDAILGRTSGAYLGLGQNEQQMELQSSQAANQQLYGLAGAAGQLYGSGIIGGGGPRFPGSSGSAGGGFGSNSGYPGYGGFGFGGNPNYGGLGAG